MKFVVFGTGGVGGFFGGKLANAGEDVWFVARGKHLEEMQQSGLRVHSTEGDFTIPPGKMTNRPEEIGPADVILFCVKSYDTESAAQRLAPMLNKETIIISLQNGIDNEEKIQRTIPTGVVWGGVSYIYATVAAPGEIKETGGPKKIIFGPLTENDSSAQTGKHILSATQRARINADFSPDILKEIWKKFIFIAAVGGLTASTRLTLGEILASTEHRQQLEDAMNETLNVAQARGISIGQAYNNLMFKRLKTFSDSSRSSMYYDLTHGKPLEIEAFSGTIIRYGDELGISTPVHRKIYETLFPFHLKHLSLKDGSL